MDGRLGRKGRAGVEPRLDAVAEPRQREARAALDVAEDVREVGAVAPQDGEELPRVERGAVVAFWGWRRQRLDERQIYFRALADARR